MRLFITGLVAMSLMGATAHAQRSLSDRIGGSGTRTVAFSTRSRDETCGDGRTSYNDGLSPLRSRFYDGVLLTHEPWDSRIPPCERGPVRVTIRVVDGVASWLRVSLGPVGTLGDTVQDLGIVSAVDAGNYLAELARGSDGRIAREALQPLVLVDSTPRWEILAAAARDSSHLMTYRRRASDLLARAAASTLGVEASASDDDASSARRDAVYALARQREQRVDPIPDLLRIAQSNPHRDARVAALHELGQNADARALDLFSTMLRGKR